MSTATALAPSPTSDTTRTGTPAVPAAVPSVRFSPVNRARGYHRVGAAVVAAGTRDGVAQRLTIGLERVCVATITHRASSAPLEVAVGAGVKTTAVLRKVADELGLTGRIETSARTPWARDSGADVDSATAIAAAISLLEATDSPMTKGVRAAIVAGLGGRALLPLEEGIGIFDTATGAWTDRYETAPRFHVQLWHRPGSTTETIETAGSLPTGAMPEDPAEAGAWLSAANGTPSGALGELLAHLHDTDPDVLGVVGGHTEHDPIALLLPVESVPMEAAHRLAAQVQARFPDAGGYVRTFARQATIL